MSMVNTHWFIGPSIVLVEKSLSLSLFVIKNAHHVSKSCRLSIQSRRNIELIDFWWRCYPGVLASIIATHHYLLVVLLLMYVKKYWFSFLSIQSMMLNNADSSCLASLGDFWKKKWCRGGFIHYHFCVSFSTPTRVRGVHPLVVQT